MSRRGYGNRAKAPHGLCGAFGKIEEIEIQIHEVQAQIRSIRQEKISSDNIYRLLLAFDQVYAAENYISETE